MKIARIWKSVVWEISCLYNIVVSIHMASSSSYLLQKIMVCFLLNQRVQIRVRGAVGLSIYNEVQGCAAVHGFVFEKFSVF